MSIKYDPSKITNPKLLRVVNEKQNRSTDPYMHHGDYKVAYGDTGHTYSFLSKSITCSKK